MIYSSTAIFKRYWLKIEKKDINIAANETNIKFFDICSGVEERPGLKNIKKLETIVELIRNEK